MGHFNSAHAAAQRANLRRLSALPVETAGAQTHRHLVFAAYHRSRPAIAERRIAGCELSLKSTVTKLESHLLLATSLTIQSCAGGILRVQRAAIVSVDGPRRWSL